MIYYYKKHKNENLKIKYLLYCKCKRKTMNFHLRYYSCQRSRWNEKGKLNGNL